MNKFLGNPGDIIVVKNNIPAKELNLLRRLYPNTKIVKEEKLEEIEKVIVRVNEELTDEERELFLELYPGATILVEE